MWVIILLLISITSLFAQDLPNFYIQNKILNNVKLNVTPISQNKVRVKVLDADGLSVEGLTRKDFRVEKNGFQGEVIGVIPLSESKESSLRILLCLDNSESMSQSVDDLLKILDDIVKSFPIRSKVSVYFFNEKKALLPYKFKNVQLNIISETFNRNDQNVRQYYHKKYKELTTRTYLYDQMYCAFSDIKSEKDEKRDIYYIIFSDGIDTGSETKPPEVINQYNKGKAFIVDFSRGKYKNKALLDISESISADHFVAINADQVVEYFEKIKQRIVFSEYEITYKIEEPLELISIRPDMFRDGFYKPINGLKVDEFKIKEFFPLLNYIFFDHNSALIGDKYVKLNKNNTHNFDESKLKPDQLEIYYNILNIFGQRLNKFRTAKLKIFGCNSNVEEEKNNTNLTSVRAEIIKNYLVEVWGIATDRISIQTKNLPDKPSNPRHTSGAEENRRVELYSDVEEILDPVQIESNTFICEPELLHLKVDAKKRSLVHSWALIVSQDDEIITNVKHSEILPEYIQWNVAKQIANKRILNSDLTVGITTFDRTGTQSGSITSSIPLSLRTIEKKKFDKAEDKYIEKLSLVLFDFNSSQLSSRNQRILFKVKNSIKPNSTLFMKGYTDSIGTESGNLKLSQSRGKNAMIELKKLLKPETTMLFYDGFGEINPLYDNGSPEGRFYNRTCQLTIETPIIEQ